jgi:hypothetical protein
MSDAMNQHKKMAMGQGVKGYKSGGQVKPMNFGPPAATEGMSGGLPPKSGLPNSPITKVKRSNGIKGV